MLFIITTIFILATFFGYNYYLKPIAQRKRYIKLIKSLGYTVYEHPFSFLGLSFAEEFQNGAKNHKDAMYKERTIYPKFDVAIGNVFDKIQLFLINPDLIKEFYNGTVPYKYPKYEFILKGTTVVIGQGLVFSEGDSWKNKRKLLSKVFNFDLIRENIPKIIQICNRCYDQFDQNHKTSDGKFKYSTQSLSARIFNGVMMRCFFGVDRVQQKIKGLDYQVFVVETMSRSAELTLNPLFVFFGKIPWDIGLTKNIRQVKEAVKIMRTLSSQFLKQRTEQVLSSPKKDKCTDIIQALVYEKLANKQQFSYSDQQLVDQFQTFLIAGTDTTTRFFSMIIYYIGKYPQIHRKVRQEVNSIIKSDADITSQNLKKLTYIDWVQYQTTRFYGPANGIFFRLAAQDNYIKDIPIVKGTVVTTQPRGNHFSQKYFKNPNEFRPERWESECEGIHPFAFIGFGAGLRSCIGKQLAHLQSKIALVKLIMRYQTIEVPEQVTLKIKLLLEADPFDVVLTKKATQNV